jgi:type I restriction enzyme S subunit
MKSNYRNIGDFIKLVDERNKGLKVTNLVGLSISKQFIKSVANIIGTDMENYKIIRKNQFACSTMQVRRDKKMPLALYNDSEPAIISQAYPVFQINDTSQLLPEYLMMWFTRSEFDREACFHAVGGVRGSLEWEDFCGMQLPIPSPEKQREIVREYHVIQNRIELNNQLISKLEESAHAIYKQWFVDFEFPNENGLLYKSNSGKMVWCEELEKEIPDGWENIEIGEIANIKAGGDRPKIFSEISTNEISIPIFSNGVTTKGLYGYTNKANYTKDSITISARGTIGYCVLRNEDFDAIVRLLVVMPKLPNSVIYLWQAINKIEFDNSGSVQNQLTIPQVSIAKIVLPNRTILEKYQMIQNKIYAKIEVLEKETQKLTGLKELLLAKMTRVESAIENIK